MAHYIPAEGDEWPEGGVVRGPMLLGTLLLALLNPVSPPAPAPVDVRAECLKSCAGAPKDATGKVLLACLQRCEPASTVTAVDAGVL